MKVKSRQSYLKKVPSVSFLVTSKIIIGFYFERGYFGCYFKDYFEGYFKELRLNDIFAFRLLNVPEAYSSGKYVNIKNKILKSDHSGGPITKLNIFCFILYVNYIWNRVFLNSTNKLILTI